MQSSVLAQGVQFSSSEYVVVGVVAVIALIALAIGMFLRQQVLAYDEGTQNMRDIGKAVQEGASAFLQRQFRTLAPFIVIVFLVLLALPADNWGERIARSIAFVFGALFSMSIGGLGMNLATKANIRVAAASNRPGGRDEGARIAFRTGGVVGMATVGLGLLGA
jgi:K(+)-stimulated pyrophosphate-energized sodium pump